MRYNGKVLPQAPKLATVVEGLERIRSTPLKVVIVDYLGEGDKKDVGESWIEWDSLVNAGEATRVKEGKSEIDFFYQGAFDYPLWVLFSSGTTGKVRPSLRSAFTEGEKLTL